MLTEEDVNKFIDSFEASGKNIASVAAQTGTGKSTMFPYGFYKRGLNIFVVQPTVTASTDVASYMKTKIPAEDIGTAVEGDIRYKNEILYGHNKTTPLVYCTAGHLRNIMLRYGEETSREVSGQTPPPFVDYIFLDEAHSGDLQYDTIMYMYNYILKKSSNIVLPKLLLITATPGVYPFRKSKIFNVYYPGAKSYPVDLQYHNRDYTNLKGKDYKQIFEDVVDVVVQKHEENPVPMDQSDGWLIFCPGKSEIMGVVDALRLRTQGTVIIPLFSSMEDASEINHNYTPPDGIRKIVVATNVAEASITIDKLSGVFDTLVEKTTMEGRNGGTMLVIVNISKSSAKQRKGRTGRNVPGFCYRMCTEEYFETKLQEVRLREIQRISPDGMILDLLSRRLDVQEVVCDKAIPDIKLDESIKRLTTIGLIADRGSDSPAVTIAANWIKRTPLSPRNGMFWWLWIEYAEFNPYIGAVITAVMETYSSGYFYFGDLSEEESREIIKQNFYPVLNGVMSSSSDKTSLRFNVRLIQYIISVFKTLEISKSALKNYCQSNNLNNQQVSACLKLIRQLLTTYKRKKTIEIGNFDVDVAIDKGRAFIYQCYSDLSYNPVSSKRYKLKSEIEGFKKLKDAIYDRIIPISTFETEFKIFVSLYESIGSLPLAKIIPPTI